jgi:hypothetical protein
VQDQFAIALIQPEIHLLRDPAPVQEIPGKIDLALSVNRDPGHVPYQ